MYHPTCHSLRGLRVGDRPYRLLRAVSGLELVELPRADECCGFGGTFAVKNSETSAAMGEDKAAAVEASGAEVLVAGDRSCLMHIGGVLSRTGASPVRTLHLIRGAILNSNASAGLVSFTGESTSSKNVLSLANELANRAFQVALAYVGISDGAFGDADAVAPPNSNGDNLLIRSPVFAAGESTRSSATWTRRSRRAA